MSNIERRHVFIAKIQADEAKGIADELRHLARRLERGELSYGVSGGVSSGYAYSYRENPHQTHETYFEQIEAELDADLAKASA